MFICSWFQHQVLWSRQTSCWPALIRGASWLVVIWFRVLVDWFSFSGILGTEVGSKVPGLWPVLLKSHCCPWDSKVREVGTHSLEVCLLTSSSVEGPGCGDGGWSSSSSLSSAALRVSSSLDDGWSPSLAGLEGLRRDSSESQDSLRTEATSEW